MADDDKSGSSKQKAHDRAIARFPVAISAESDNRAKELDDLKFLAASPDDHWQWPDTIYNLRTAPGQEGGVRPCLTINKLPQHHRQVTNEQKMNRPQIRVQPVDDVADPETAKIINGYLRHMQVASEADLAYDMAGDAQVAHGVGYFRILTDYCDEMSHDQEILIKPLPDRFKVYMDPEGLKKHPAGRECRWGFIIEDLPKEEYETQFGDDHPIDWNDSAIGDRSDWFPDKETVRIAEYLEIEDTADTLYLYQVGDQFIPGLKSKPMPKGVPKAALPVKERKTKISRCKWYKMNGQKVLSEKEMPTKYLPIVRVVGNQWIVEGKPVISGIVRNAKDAVRMYNYNASMEVELNALAPRAPFIAMDEQIKGKEDMWRKANSVNYGVLTYNAVIDEATGAIVTVAAPQRAQPQMPQAAIIAAKMAAGDDIKATTGQYDPSLGNNPTAKSGIALQREQSKTEVGTFHYVDNYARALRYAGTIILDMMPRVIDTKRVLRILGEDGEADHVMVDPDLPTAYQEVLDQATQKKLGKVYNLAVGKYDVVVSTGPSFATQREEARAMLVEMSQGTTDPVVGTVIRYLTVKNMDWSGAQEMADMLKKLLPPNLMEENEDEDQPTVPTPEGPLPIAQAAQFIQALMGKLQQAGEQVKAAGDLEGQAAAIEKKRAELQGVLDKITAGQAEIAAARRELDLRTKLAETSIENKQLNATEALRQEAASLVPPPVEQPAEPQRPAQPIEVVDSSVAGSLGAAAQAMSAMAEAVTQQSVVLQEVARSAAAPRKIELLTDPKTGRPTGAVSQPVLLP